MLSHSQVKNKLRELDSGMTAATPYPEYASSIFKGHADWSNQGGKFAFDNAAQPLDVQVEPRR